MAVPASAGEGLVSRRWWSGGLCSQSEHVLWSLLWACGGGLSQPGGPCVCTCSPQQLQADSQKWEARVSEGVQGKG